jgi:hypothetical protein
MWVSRPLLKFGRLTCIYQHLSRIFCQLSINVHFWFVVDLLVGVRRFELPRVNVTTSFQGWTATRLRAYTPILNYFWYTVKVTLPHKLACKTSAFLVEPTVYIWWMVRDLNSQCFRGRFTGACLTIRLTIHNFLFWWITSVMLRAK